MPDNEFHYNQYKAGYLVEIPAFVYLLLQNPVFAIGDILGYSFHRYCDNDWDIVGTSGSEGRMMNELKFVGNFLYGISSVYGSFARQWHRKPITHWPVLSTFFRILFVFWWILLLYYFRIINYQSWHLIFFLGFWFGLSKGDFIHFLCDKIWPDKNMLLNKEKDGSRRLSSKPKERKAISSDSKRKDKRDFSNKSNSRNSISSRKIFKNHKANLDKLQARFRYIKFTKRRTYKE